MNHTTRDQKTMARKLRQHEVSDGQPPHVFGAWLNPMPNQGAAIKRCVARRRVGPVLLRLFVVKVHILVIVSSSNSAATLLATTVDVGGGGMQARNLQVYSRGHGDFALPWFHRQYVLPWFKNVWDCATKSVCGAAFSPGPGIASHAGLGASAGGKVSGSTWLFAHVCLYCVSLFGRLHASQTWGQSSWRVK